jgi:5-methylcytosine-specific restriction enzyme A
MKHALRICNEPGCPQIAGDGGKCAAHQAQRARTERTQRPTPAQQGYDWAWRKIRAAFLAKHPYCEHCPAYATEVDHILPLSRGGTHDEDNLESFCKSCHSKKTARETGGWQKAAKHGIMT